VAPDTKKDDTMSSKRSDETPGVISRSDGVGADGLNKRNFIDENDVEGHNLRRDGEGVRSQRGATLDEGLHKRNAIPDGGDDVEGHSIMHGGEGVRAPFSDEAPGGEGLTRKVSPGEGHSSRA
jgi:hypothetical protein